jgi:hypothetical protein
MVTKWAPTTRTLSVSFSPAGRVDTTLNFEKPSILPPNLRWKRVLAGLLDGQK